MFLPNEIHLIIVEYLPPSDRKAYRLANRQCNHVCRPKVWEKIILHADIYQLKKQIKAAKDFTWKGCDPTVSTEDGAAGWLTTSPIIRDLTICFSVSEEVMELQARALKRIAPVLLLKTLLFERPTRTCLFRDSTHIRGRHPPLTAPFMAPRDRIFTHIIVALRAVPHTDIYILPITEMKATTATCLMNLNAFARDFPTRIRSFDFVATTKISALPGPEEFLGHLTNLQNLKIHFDCSFQYHDPDFQIPSSVTNLTMIGPLRNWLSADDFDSSRAFRHLPERLTTLNLKTEVITCYDLDDIVRLPNLRVLRLIARVFCPLKETIKVEVKPFPDYVRGKNLEHFGFHITESAEQGPYVNSIIRSSPKLERLSLRWFIPEDIRILPEFCPKLKLLNLQHAHPLYPPSKSKVFGEMFRDVLPRLTKLTSMHFLFQNSVRVDTLDFMKCAVQSPDLFTIILEERDPARIPKDLTLDFEPPTRSFTNVPAALLEDWPRDMIISGPGCLVDVNYIRKMYVEMPLHKRVLGEMSVPGY